MSLPFPFFFLNSSSLFSLPLLTFIFHLLIPTLMFPFSLLLSVNSHPVTEDRQHTDCKQWRKAPTLLLKTCLCASATEGSLVKTHMPSCPCCPAILMNYKIKYQSISIPEWAFLQQIQGKRIFSLGTVSGRLANSFPVSVGICFSLILLKPF